MNNKIELAIGTKLLFFNNTSKTIHTIVRETNTLWVTDKDSKIKKSDGSIYGNNSCYNITNYKLLTDEDIKDIKDSNAKHRIIKKIRELDLNKLDLETLTKIDEIIS